MISKLYSWYGKTPVRIVGALIVVLASVAIGTHLLTATEDTEQSEAVAQRSVTVAPIGTLGAGDSRTFVGTVEAVNRARLESEASGRVVSVPVRIGNRIAAGAVIAQLENSAQRAAVTQAEGAYQAAVAGAQQSDSGVRDAETALRSAQNEAVSTIRSAYSTVNATFLNSIDVFFSNPNGPVPGLRIEGRGNTQLLNSERVAFQTILPQWRNQTNTISADSNLEPLLLTAETNTARARDMVDIFITLTREQNNANIVQGQPVTAYTAGLLAERANLNATLQSLSAARTNLERSRENLARATIGGTGSTVSVADAQIMQAQGALQAAQAQLNKTIIRTPIAGTINSLSVQAGDFITSFAPVAEIVNESAYQVTIFVSEQERQSFQVGTVVVINNDSTGTVTNIAPGIDARTQKIEVVIATESTDVIAGSTALVTLESAPQATQLQVPLTAISFATEQGALLVVEDGKVAALPVSIGTIRGSYVTLQDSEIDPTQEIIVDARGLVVGQQVTVTN